MKEILVESIMTKEVSCLPSDAQLRDAVQLMVNNQYSCIVVTRQQSPIGIVTERDLVKVLLAENHDDQLSQPISNVMSSPVMTLEQEASLFDALVVNRAEKIRHIPVVDSNGKLAGLLTMTDLVNAHFRVTEMQSQLIERATSSKTLALQELNEELRTLSMVDHLMQIGNRRAMEVDLTHTHSNSLRHNTIYAILLLDIDYFKLFNDYYGHQAGDNALKQVATVMKQAIRSSDRIYRYGGEELLIILPHTNLDQAMIIAENIVTEIRDYSIPHTKSPYEYLTISCGCAAISPQQKVGMARWEQLVKVADHALYQAKSEGRSRVVNIMDLHDLAAHQVEA